MRILVPAISLSIFSAIGALGCTTETSGAQDELNVEETSDELSRAAKSIVGAYSSVEGQITLYKDGTYRGGYGGTTRAKGTTLLRANAETGQFRVVRSFVPKSSTSGLRVQKAPELTVELAGVLELVAIPAPSDEPATKVEPLFVDFEKLTGGDLKVSSQLNPKIVQIWTKAPSL